MPQPALHLYLTPGACSLASHIALTASGLPFNTTDLKAKAGFPTEHLHLNPKGRVPILSIDDELLTESPAIMATISALAPEKHLLGKTLIENARCHEWLAYLCGTVHGQAFGCLFRPARFVNDASLHDVVKARGRAWVGECFSYIESQLSDGKKFAVGEGFTVVDGYLLVFYRWGNLCGMEMGKNYPRYDKLVRGLLEVESVRSTIEAEGINALND